MGHFPMCTSSVLGAFNSPVLGFALQYSQGESSHEIIKALNTNSLSYIPLVTPATKSDRIAKLAALATGFV